MIFAPYHVLDDEKRNLQCDEHHPIRNRTAVVDRLKSNLGEPFLLASMAELGKVTWFNFK